VDPQHRGKGYALAFAFARSQADGTADAVVVVDADTTVSPNLLQAFAARLDCGAAAIQASYGVSNPFVSWRTRLMTLALALFNDVRSLGRERLGVSAGLKGNGMCFTHALLREVPHEAYSRVEDLEYGIRLGRAGHRIHYAWEAQVKGEMVSSERAARSQRRRWEGGRVELVRTQLRPLLRDAWAKRSGLRLDLALDLLVPPLSYLALGAAGLNLVGLVLVVWSGSIPLATLTVAGWVDGMLLLYVLRGWWIAGVGVRGLLDLLWAPVFVAWKLMLLFSRSEHSRGEWIRTQREQESKTHGP
jgi:cellulose synthase/poly-beta-1,6-N-acetylglucosamine synthase-like glycosyltransferase